MEEVKSADVKKVLLSTEKIAKFCHTEAQAMLDKECTIYLHNPLDVTLLQC